MTLSSYPLAGEMTFAKINNKRNKTKNNCTAHLFLLCIYPQPPRLASTPGTAVALKLCKYLFHYNHNVCPPCIMSHN